MVSDMQCVGCQNMNGKIFFISQKVKLLKYEEILRSTAHLIIEFPGEAGFENTSNLQDGRILDLFLDSCCLAFWIEIMDELKYYICDTQISGEE